MPKIPTCICCGRCIADYHAPDCTYRSEAQPFVRDYSCHGYVEPESDLHDYERDDFEEYLFPQGD